MAEPKLELKKNKERLARLAAVKQTARLRTNRRIQMILDDIQEQKALKDGTLLEAPKKEGK